MLWPFMAAGRDNGAAWVILKYNGELVSQDVKASSDIHAAVARRFDIPLQSLKLIHKGKVYPPDRAEELLGAHFASKTPVFVMGTPRRAQVAGRVQRWRLQQAGQDAVGLVIGVVKAILGGVWLFFTSLFTSPTAAPAGGQGQG